MRCSLLIAGSVLFAAGASAQDARAILQKVQDTYSNMRSAVFQGVRTLDTRIGGKETRAETRIQIAMEKPNKVRVQYDYPGADGEWLRVANGKNFFGFREVTHEKKQSPASPRDMDILNGTFVDRFRQITRNLQSAKVDGSEKLDVGGAHDCWVVEATYKAAVLPNGEVPLPTKYWIDKQRNLVLQEQSGTRSRSKSGLDNVTNTRTLSFVQAEVNSQVPDVYFAFNPPRP